MFNNVRIVTCVYAAFLIMKRCVAVAPSLPKAPNSSNKAKWPVARLEKERQAWQAERINKREISRGRNRRGEEKRREEKRREEKRREGGERKGYVWR